MGCAYSKAPRSARSPAGPTKSSALLSLFADLFSRLVAATLCASFALVLWDTITQSRLPRRLLRAVVGAVFAIVALVLIASVSGPVRRDFSLIAIGVFLAGLTVDALIGEGIRAGIGLRR